MQQVLDECTRRVDQQKAHYEQIYSEKIKEVWVKLGLLRSLLWSEGWNQAIKIAKSFSGFYNYFYL